VKDFDAQRHEREANRDGRSFTIGGETIVARASVRPDLWLDYFDRRAANLSGESVMGNVEYIAFLDAHVLAVIEPEYVEVWRRVRTDADPAITLGDIGAVVDFLWEIQSGRPPTPPADSLNGSETEPSGTNSTDSSSSQREEVLTG
jgi:hypothetical protein